MRINPTASEDGREYPMIERVWHGWTTPENADEYERLLTEEIVPEIDEKTSAGYEGIRVGRRPLESEVEFITIMRFESLADVEKFAGEDYEQAHVPQKAREVLKRWDEKAQHYELRDQHTPEE